MWFLTKKWLYNTIFISTKKWNLRRLREVCFFFSVLKNYDVEIGKAIEFKKMAKAIQNKKALVNNQPQLIGKEQYPSSILTFLWLLDEVSVWWVLSHPMVFSFESGVRLGLGNIWIPFLEEF